MNAYAINDWDEIEARYFGKNAMPGWDIEEFIDGGKAATAPAKREPLHVRKARQKKESLRRKEMIEEYKEHEHYISRKRFREAILAVLGISLIALMFSFILYRQSQITLQNYENNAMLSRIGKLREETSQVQENLILSVELDQIRCEAMERLGMQDPSVRQVVTVEIPGNDLLVTNDFETNAINSKSSLAAAKQNLAQYYSAME